MVTRQQLIHRVNSDPKLKALFEKNHGEPGETIEDYIDTWKSKKPDIVQRLAEDLGIKEEKKNVNHS